MNPYQTHLMGQRWSAPWICVYFSHWGHNQRVVALLWIEKKTCQNMKSMKTETYRLLTHSTGKIPTCVVHQKLLAISKFWSAHTEQMWTVPSNVWKSSTWGVATLTIGFSTHPENQRLIRDLSHVDVIFFDWLILPSLYQFPEGILFKFTPSNLNMEWHAIFSAHWTI